MWDESKVALIIVNWNCGEILAKCLTAVRLQTLPPTRIILFDNASKDDSVSVIERRFPEVEIMEASVNLGFADKKWFRRSPA